MTRQLLFITIEQGIEIIGKRREFSRIVIMHACASTLFKGLDLVGKTLQWA